MLVFISDVHMTDGTSSQTINSGAFEKCAQHICDLYAKANLENAVQGRKLAPLEIVLLGDIFDVIRSKYWLDLHPKVRPWAIDEEPESYFRHALRSANAEIVRRICHCPKNINSIAALRGLGERIRSDKGLKADVKITYMIGNHDWLLNEFGEARKEIARFLGLESPESYELESNRFKHEGFWSEYGVFARHGDIYDEYNYDGHRSRSSLGDAIVIELINKFPESVRAELAKLGKSVHGSLISELDEVDNVRPVLDVPKWISAKCQKANSPEIADIVKQVWNALVEEFFQIPYIKKQNSLSDFKSFIRYQKLKALLSITSGFSLQTISSAPVKAVQWVQEYFQSYGKHAVKEAPVDSAAFILYGHTHDHVVEPLDRHFRKGRNPIEKMYINTGTWRKVHTKMTQDKENHEFASWNVMTFVAFYLEDERGENNFEVWNGALG